MKELLTMMMSLRTRNELVKGDDLRGKGFTYPDSEDDEENRKLASVLVNKLHGQWNL